MTHPELGSLGESLILEINKFFKEGEKSGGLTRALLEQLPALLLGIVEFIGAALSTRGPNNGVAY